MKNKDLTKKEIAKLCTRIPSWKLTAKETKLSKEFVFKDHIDALVFIARVTVHAQIQAHHPEIIYTFKKVQLILSTHEVKGLTKKDFTFATTVDRLSAVDK